MEENQKSEKGSNNSVSNKRQSNGNELNLDEKQGLRDLLLDEMKHIYWGEKELTKAIPKMIKNATAEELIDALTGHLEVTKEHVNRLEKAFSYLDEKAEAMKCSAMEGLIKEAEGIMEETKEGIVRDAGIISAGKKVEHYEIATYCSLCSFAKNLGEDAMASLLQETLDEEKEANEKLTEIAKSMQLEMAV